MNCVVYIWTSDHFNAHSFRWVKAFKAEKFSVEDDTRPGRPKTSVTKANVAAVKIVVKQDAQLSVKNIASCTSISEGSVQTILKKAFGPEKGLRYVGTSFAHWGAKGTTS